MVALFLQERDGQTTRMCLLCQNDVETMEDMVLHFDVNNIDTPEIISEKLDHMQWMMLMERMDEEQCRIGHYIRARWSDRNTQILDGIGNMEAGIEALEIIQEEVEADDELNWNMDVSLVLNL